MSSNSTCTTTSFEIGKHLGETNEFLQNVHRIYTIGNSKATEEGSKKVNSIIVCHFSTKSYTTGPTKKGNERKNFSRENIAK